MSGSGRVENSVKPNFAAYYLQTSPRPPWPPAKGQTIFTYYSPSTFPMANDFRIAHAKPIAPPRPPRQQLPPNLPTANAPAGHTRALPGFNTTAHLR